MKKKQISEKIIAILYVWRHEEELKWRKPLMDLQECERLCRSPFHVFPFSYELLKVYFQP